MSQNLSEKSEDSQNEVYNLESLAGLPKEIKWAFHHLNKHNQTKRQSVDSVMSSSDTDIQNFQTEAYYQSG